MAQLADNLVELVALGEPLRLPPLDVGVRRQAGGDDPEHDVASQPAPAAGSALIRPQWHLDAAGTFTLRGAASAGSQPGHQLIVREIVRQNTQNS